MARSVRLYEVCVFAILGCLQSLVSGFTEEYGPTHTRQWSDWYNTDHPRWGRGDDESVVNIRRRGFEVCDGSAPLDSVCRISDKPDVVFNEETTAFTKDHLAVPCTPAGIVCRNYDQSRLTMNHTCRDYEIRFECLTVVEDPRSPNLNVIGVAAGLSVVIPIVCVIIMHVVRKVKERRRLREAGSSEGGTENQESQTDYSSLPPSYDQLFGLEYGSTENLLGPGSSVDSLPVSSINSTETQTTESSSVDSSAGLSRSNSQNSPTGSALIYNISDGQLSNLNDNTTTLHTENELQPTRRLHFPGMHLSIFDLMTSQDGGHRSSQCSPEVSPVSIRTPPPSYGDALVILGGIPSKIDSDK